MRRSSYGDDDRTKIIEFVRSAEPKLLALASDTRDRRTVQQIISSSDRHAERIVIPSTSSHLAEAEHIIIKKANTLCADGESEQPVLLILTTYLIGRKLESLFAGSSLNRDTHYDDVRSNALLSLVRRFGEPFDWSDPIGLRTYVNSTTFNAYVDCYRSVFRPNRAPKGRKQRVSYYSEAAQDRYRLTASRCLTGATKSALSQRPLLDQELWQSRYDKGMLPVELSQRFLPDLSELYATQKICRALADARRAVAREFVKSAPSWIITAMYDRRLKHRSFLDIDFELAGAILAEAGRLPPGATGHRGRHGL